MYFNIQRFSTHDGDGIRTILFLKGCSLSCLGAKTQKAAVQSTLCCLMSAVVWRTASFVCRLINKP